MNIKKVAKKIVALTMGATLVGATILGAVAAADLGAYPAPFITDNTYDAKIVVGENAAAKDIIGAADVATSLQALSYVETEVVTGTGTTVVSDGEVEDDLYIGVPPLTDDKDYDEGDITILNDDDVRYNGTNYDYEEIIHIGTDFFEARTGQDKEEFGTGVYLAIDKDDTTYYRWDVSANPIPIGGDRDLEINFLGQTLTITDTQASNTIVVTKSDDAWLYSGETMTVTIDDVDYVIELKGVYDEKSVFVVNGITKTINDDDDWDFGYDDFQLELTDSYNDEGTDNDQAEFKYGSATSQTAQVGDALELLGYGDEATEAEWVWDISADATQLNYVGVVYNQDRDEHSSEDLYDYELPTLALGESVTFPNDFAIMEFAALNNNDVREKFTVTLEKTYDFKDENNTAIIDDGDVIVFESGGAEIFEIGGSTYKRVVLETDMSDVGLVDANGERTTTGYSATMLDIEVDDDPIDVNFTNSSSYITNMTINNIGTPTIAIGVFADDLIWSFGASSGWTEDADATDLSVVYPATNIATRDYDFMTGYGVIISDLESSLENDYGYIEFSFPTEAVTWDLAVSATPSSTTGGTGVSQTIVPITNVAVLDSEIEVGSGNLIVVGGPCANSIAYDLMGNDVCNADFTQGKGLIKMWETGDYMAIMVAGYEADDTLAAVDVIVNYGDYAEEFAGKSEVEVTTATKEVTEVVPVVPDVPDTGNQT